MTNHRQIPISLPDTGEAEWEALRESVFSGWLTQGPKVGEFEKKFADRLGVAHAIATTSCTTALHLILKALGVGPGDEVVVPAFTWVATANVVVHCGGTPVLVDVSPDTFNLDPEALANCLTPNTKAIIPVHLFGRCANMKAIRDIAGDIPLVEDAACAVGAKFRGTPAGALGTAAAFSFHPRKILTTGEGGMVTTNSDALAETMRRMRNHGASISEEQRHAGPRPYLLPDFDLLGFNYRMTDLQGSVGLVQLGKVDGFLQERRKWAQFYEAELASVEWLRTPTVDAEDEHGWQSYVCLVEPDRAPMSRNEIMERLQEVGVSTRPGTHALSTLGYYQKQWSVREDSFPGALVCHEQSMAIPLHNRMVEEDYAYVVDALKGLA